MSLRHDGWRNGRIAHAPAARAYLLLRFTTGDSATLFFFIDTFHDYERTHASDRLATPQRAKVHKGPQRSYQGPQPTCMHYLACLGGGRTSRTGVRTQRLQHAPRLDVIREPKLQTPYVTCHWTNR